MFSKPITNPMRLDRPVVYDISAIGEAESDLRAAAMALSSVFVVTNSLRLRGFQGSSRG